MTQPWPTLHVYPSISWHDEVTILGTAAALRHLADKLLEAVSAEIAVASVSANDGEDYWLPIVRVDDIDDRHEIRPPYLSEHANGPVVAGDLPIKIRRRIRAAIADAMQERRGTFYA